MGSGIEQVGKMDDFSNWEVKCWTESNPSHATKYCPLPLKCLYRPNGFKKATTDVPLWTKWLYATDYKPDLTLWQTGNMNNPTGIHSPYRKSTITFHHWYLQWGICVHSPTCKHVVPL